MLKKYRITTTHTVIASSQQEALHKLAKVTAARPKNSEKLAEQMADQMIEVACKYAGKWGRISNIGFVTMYGHAQGLVILDKSSLYKFLIKQRENLIETVKNDGLCEKGVCKGKQFELENGDVEDNIFKIFISLMHRLGLAIASKDGDEILGQVFNKVEPEDKYDRAAITSREDEGRGGISKAIRWIARISYANLKPAYKQGVEGWEKMFKVLNKYA